MSSEITSFVCSESNITIENTVYKSACLASPKEYRTVPYTDRGSL